MKIVFDFTDGQIAEVNLKRTAGSSSWNLTYSRKALEGPQSVVLEQILDTDHLATLRTLLTKALEGLDAPLVDGGEASPKDGEQKGQNDE